jgi:uncharacterized protein
VEIFFHRPKCIIRSKLWDENAWPDISGLSTLTEAMVAQGKLTETREEITPLIEKDAQERLY